MAKGKKAAALTPEEKLQQALVPVEEQPYQVPGNWCWIHLLESFENKTDSKKKVQSKTYLEHGNLAVVDQGQELIGGYTNDENMSFSGPLPVIIFGDHTRCIKYIDFPFAQGADGIKVLVPKSFYRPRAFFYALQSIDIPNMGYRRHYPLFPQFAIPVPPLPEQQRIVDRIESLFAKLDEAKEKAQAVVDGFELRKSAILHQAFTGELTKEWRQEHGVGMESWERKTVSSICGSLKYGTAKKSEKTGTVVVIRMGNLQQGEIDWTDLAYSNDEDDIQKYRLEAGDVLFNRTNSAALVGKTSIYRGEYPAIYAGYLIKLDYNHDIVIGDFFNYALNTNDVKEYCNSVKTDGVNQSNINAQKIGAYKIPVPKIEEQKEIVVILQKLLSAEQQAKDAAEAVLDQIDTMKKAILARAFRGELGTNDPAEESAEELLKTVIQ
jgi:type I restriction enzyme S subunit